MAMILKVRTTYGRIWNSLIHQWADTGLNIINLAKSFYCVLEELQGQLCAGNGHHKTRIITISFYVLQQKGGCAQYMLQNNLKLWEKQRWILSIAENLCDKEITHNIWVHRANVSNTVVPQMVIHCTHNHLNLATLYWSKWEICLRHIWQCADDMSVATCLKESTKPFFHGFQSGLPVTDGGDISPHPDHLGPYCLKHALVVDIPGLKQVHQLLKHIRPGKLLA